MAGPARRLCVIAVCAAGLAGLAGCGDDDGGGDGGGPQTLRVGVLPIADLAPLYVGQEQGFFEEEELTIEPQVMQGGAEVTAAVISGDMNLGFAATEPLIVAASQGVPVQIVTQGNQAAETEAEAWDGLMVNDPAIQELSDLEGKTIGVNALKSMPELCTRAVLERAGVDVSQIEFTEIPFPEMTAALEGGRVDAVTAVEPFVTQAKAGGARSLGSYLTSLEPKLTVGTYFGTSEYIEANEDVVERFANAMNRSLEYTQAHPDEAREAVLGYTEIPPEVAREMKLSFWGTDLNRPTIELIADEAERFGFVEERPDVEELIWDGAEG
jgi:NitT/TauT family transport system substrate-binding protein